MPVTYKKIASVTVTGATAANMEFTSIPGTYTDLIILVSARGNDTVFVSRTLEITFNNNTSNRSSRRLLGSGSAASSASFASNIYGGQIPTATSTSSTFGNNFIYIPNYAGSANKSYSADGVGENNATEAYQSLWAGLWSNTAAITSIQLFPDVGSFVTNSTATLYGISKS